MIKNVKEYLYTLIPVLVIFWIVYINRFPEGYVYNSGDFSQPINLVSHFQNLFYTWGNRIASTGEGGSFSWFAAIPYYFLFYILPTHLGLNDTQDLSFVFFGFLFLSYISFYVSQKLLFGKQKGFTSKLFPLLYSVNMTTLYFFAYTWGFSHHIFLYVTLPIVTSSFYLLLHDLKAKYLLILALSLLASIPGFTNAAFAMSAALFMALFLSSLIFLKDIRITKYLLFRLFIIGITSILVLSYWIIPTSVLVTSNISSISDGAFDLLTWLRTQSADLLSIIISLPGYQEFIPFSHEIKIAYILAFIPMFSVVYLLSKIKQEDKNSKAFKICLALLLTEIILFILIKKSKPPFAGQTLWLYSIPLLSTFRSYEKLAVLIPFINLTAIYGLLQNTNINRKIVNTLIIFALLAPFPFLLGGIQTKYSITIGTDKSKDYLSAKYSGLVKIPVDYYEAAEYLNTSDNTDTKIQSLPYSPLNTTSWVNFPKWKLIGFNITDYLFDKTTIASNSSQYMLYGWIPQKNFNETTLNPIWYVRLMSYLNVSHLNYQLAVDNQFILESYPKIKLLQKANVIHEEYTSQNLKLYKLADNLILPKFYIPEKSIFVNNPVSNFPYALLQNDYKDKNVFIFENGENFESLPDDGISENLTILDSIPNLEDLHNLSWDVSWPWPEDREKLKTVNDKNKDTLNTVLFNLVVTSRNYNTLLDYGYWEQQLSSLHNLLNQKNQSSTGLFMDDYIKSASYLIRINQDIFSKMSRSIDLETVLKIDRPAFCKDVCYYFSVNKNGDYEIQISKEGFESNELLSTSISIYENGEKNGKEIYHIDHLDPAGENFIILGTFSFVSSKSYYVNLQYPNQRNLLNDDDWHEYTNDEQTQLVYKKINNCIANRFYTTSNSESTLGKVEYIIAEDIPDFEKIESQDINEFLESNSEIPTVKNAVFQGSRNTRFTPRFAEAKSCYLFVEKEKIGDFENFKVYPIYNPKLVLKKPIPAVEITKVNPTKYRLKIIGAESPYSLIFNESFSPEWGIFLLGQGANREIGKNSHFVANGFSNGWTIDSLDMVDGQDYELIVEYKPQRRFYIGIIISVGTAFLLIVITIARFFALKKK